MHIFKKIATEFWGIIVIFLASHVDYKWEEYFFTLNPTVFLIIVCSDDAHDIYRSDFQALDATEFL